MENAKLYPVAYAGDLFLKRNLTGNYYLVNEYKRIYRPIGIIEAIIIFDIMTNETITFEAAFELY